MSEYNHTVDAKGRMIVPNKFRDDLGVSFVVTRGIEHCLYVYAKSEWQAVVDRINSMPRTSSDARQFARHMLGGATEVEPDGQGRILIPQYLREYAGIAKEAVLVGMGNYIEVWGKEKYTETTDNVDIEGLANKLNESGIWF